MPTSIRYCTWQKVLNKKQMFKGGGEKAIAPQFKYRPIISRALIFQMCFNDDFSAHMIWCQHYPLAKVECEEKIVTSALFCYDILHKAASVSSLLHLSQVT